MKWTIAAIISQLHFSYIQIRPRSFLFANRGTFYQKKSVTLPRSAQRGVEVGHVRLPVFVILNYLEYSYVPKTHGRTKNWEWAVDYTATKIKFSDKKSRLTAGFEPATSGVEVGNPNHWTTGYSDATLRNEPSSPKSKFEYPVIFIGAPRAPCAKIKHRALAGCRRLHLVCLYPVA